MKRKLYAAAAAFMLLPAVLTLGGCGETSEETVEEEQLPYGATVTLDSSRGITVSCDTRFIEPALADKLYTYYHSIETKNAEEFASVIFPLYHDYDMNEIYAGELDDQKLLDSTYSAIHDYFGFDFEYSMVEVTNAVTQDGESSDRDQLRQLLDDLAADKDEPNVSAHTTYFYELNMTRYLKEKGADDHAETDYVLRDEKLFALKYDDQWYLIYS